MNNNICKILIFAVGAAIGSAATWKIVETKYRKIADEEIESVREAYARRLDELIAKESDDSKKVCDAVEDPEEEDTSYVPNTKDKLNYEAIIEKFDYSKCSKKEETTKMNTKINYIRPYVIPPEEFGETEFQPITYILYNDGILIDDSDSIVSNIEELITKEALNSFGQYEDDAVYVRNENTKMDYEILLDTRDYAVAHPEAED